MQINDNELYYLICLYCLNYTAIMKTEKYLRLFSLFRSCFPHVEK